jgi:hypothetical protein
MPPIRRLSRSPVTQGATGASTAITRQQIPGPGRAGHTSRNLPRDPAATRGGHRVARSHPTASTVPVVHHHFFGSIRAGSWGAEGGHFPRGLWRRLAVMLRPESWSRLTGGSPVRVGTGAPGSRPRFVVERRRAERGVESLFGGSKRAGRSIKRTLQPRQNHDGGAEPLMSRRRPCLSGPVPGSAWRVLPGYGGRHARTVWAGTGEARLPGLRRAKTAGISRW